MQRAFLRLMTLSPQTSTNTRPVSRGRRKSPNGHGRIVIAKAGAYLGHESSVKLHFCDDVR